jgi:hypothetical protein
MKELTFWDTMPYIPLKVNQRFGGKCHLNHQAQRINQARNQHEAYNKITLAWLILKL